MTQHTTLTGLAMDNLPFDCVDGFIMKVTEKLAKAPLYTCRNGVGPYIEQTVTVSEGDSSYVVIRECQKGQTTYTIQAL